MSRGGEAIKYSSYVPLSNACIPPLQRKGAAGEAVQLKAAFEASLETSAVGEVDTAGTVQFKPFSRGPSSSSHLLTILSFTQ